MSKIVGGDHLRWALGDLRRNQIPFAMSVGINKTIGQMRDAERARIASAFKAPKAFTRNATKTQFTTKRNLHGRVNIADDAREIYLLPQEVGGKRRRKPFEKRLIRAGVMDPDEWAVPSGDVKLTRGVLVQILSQAKALPEGSASDSKRSQRAQRRAGRFFVPPRKADTMSGDSLPRGVWRRKGIFIEPVLYFTRNAPNYSKRLFFAATARREARRKLVPNLRQAAVRAMKTARRR